jgi:hypothetical protein
VDEDREQLRERSDEHKYYGLEAHLASFHDVPEYRLLCSSWDLDKDSYRKEIENSKMNYPHFSEHGEGHSQKIISAVELILGEKRIRDLSPSDTWLLLQAAYTHDIGMSMSAQELVRDMRDKKDFFEQLREACMDSQEAMEAFEFVEPLSHEANEKSKWPETYQFKKTERTRSFRMDEREKSEIFNKEDPVYWPM